LALSVVTTTTPQTPTQSETTFNRDCIQGNACAGRRLVVVFADHHRKRQQLYLFSRRLQG
jgi:hypothetical protein